MFTKEKKAAVSVINDLVSDHRVHKTCLMLLHCGYQVTLIGRVLPGSSPLTEIGYTRIRVRLIFTSGPLFYIFFNLRLFFKLLFTKTDLLFANDLDTLLPNFLVAKIKNIPIIYDSHELFTEVPELIRSPFKRKVWLWLENWIVPKLKNCMTVNDSIADIFNKKYKVSFKVVRNIPEGSINLQPITRSDLKLPADKKILILQGAGLNIDRGAEELIEAMRFVEGALLLVIGGGDVWNTLKTAVRGGLSEKVRLVDKQPRHILLKYTSASDLGISVDKNTNLNYYYSLPNKLFDYIHAGIPVLASRLPEIEKIVTQYQIGEFISDHEPKNIAKKITELIHSPKLAVYKNNTQKAAEILNWQNESRILKEIIMSV